MFRKIIRAVGGPSQDKELAYSYEAVLFNENGTFKKEIIKLHQTHARMTDPTKSQYEAMLGGEWKLISEQDFRVMKTEWDQISKANGYAKIDDDGNLVQNKEQLLQHSISKWILDLIKK